MGGRGGGVSLKCHRTVIVMKYTESTPRVASGTILQGLRSWTVPLPKRTDKRF